MGMFARSVGAGILGFAASLSAAGNARADEPATAAAPTTAPTPIKAPVSSMQEYRSIRGEFKGIEEAFKNVGKLDPVTRSSVLLDLVERSGELNIRLEKLSSSISGTPAEVSVVTNATGMLAPMVKALNEKIVEAGKQNPVAATPAPAAAPAPVAAAPAPAAPISDKEQIANERERLKNERMAQENRERAARAELDLRKRELDLAAKEAKLSGAAPAAQAPVAPQAGPIVVPPGFTDQIIQFRTNYVRQMFGGIPMTAAQYQQLSDALVYRDNTKDQFLHTCYEMQSRLTAGTGTAAASTTARGAAPAAAFPTPEREQSYRHREDRHGLSMKYGEAGLFRAWNENVYRVPNTLRNWGIKIPRFVGTSK